jgi:hypothetical protein
MLFAIAFCRAAKPSSALCSATLVTSSNTDHRHCLASPRVTGLEGRSVAEWGAIRALSDLRDQETIT